MFNVELVGDFNDHQSEVWRVDWNVTGTILSSTGDDGTLRLWKGMLYLIPSCWNWMEGPCSNWKWQIKRNYILPIYIHNELSRLMFKRPESKVDDLVAKQTRIAKVFEELSCLIVEGSFAFIKESMSFSKWIENQGQHSVKKYWVRTCQTTFFRWHPR